MNRYKLIVAYDGFDFAGWQEQPEDTAVSNSIRNSFKRVFHLPVSMVAASRTDAGVHALGQVIRITTPLAIDPTNLALALNRSLPPSILIRHASSAPADFHPQHNVIQKTYWYHFFLKRPLPFATRYGLFIEDRLSLEKLQQALQLFVGTHDFRSFCTGYDQESTVRTIDEINLSYLKRFGAWRIEFKGERFLRYMIRRITGAAIDAATRPELSVSTLSAILEAKNQRHALTNAPAHGLMLAKIRYAP